MILSLTFSLLAFCGTLRAQEADTLSLRQQSIVAIAANTATGDLENLKTALARGLDCNMTVNEIKEVLVHAYAYCGFPRSLRGLQTFMQVLDERKAQGIIDTVGRDVSPVSDSRDKYTRGAELLEKLSGAPKDAPKTGYAAFAPVIEQYLKEHLFCDIFERGPANVAGTRACHCIHPRRLGRRRGANAPLTFCHLPAPGHDRKTAAPDDGNSQ